MNVTITDIANATGLSTATISKYLNNRKIRDENRILIEKAILKLGYTPMWSIYRQLKENRQILS